MENETISVWLERLERKLFLPLNRWDVAILYMNRSITVYGGSLEGCFGVSSRLVRSLGLGKTFPGILDHSRVGEEAVLYASKTKPAVVLKGWVEVVRKTGDFNQQNQE